MATNRISNLAAAMERQKQQKLAREHAIIECVRAVDMTTRGIAAAVGMSYHSAAKYVQGLETAGSICRVLLAQIADGNGRKRDNVLYSADMRRAAPELDTRFFVSSGREAQQKAESARLLDALARAPKSAAARRELAALKVDRAPLQLRDMQERAVKAGKSRTKVQRTPSGYDVGHFTALIREHDWPPGFIPRLTLGAAPIAHLQTVRRRESDSATGKGWGGGTCVMPGTPGQPRPAFMGRIPQQTAEAA